MPSFHPIHVALHGTGGDVDISGTWRNELGSFMLIEQVGPLLSGMYTSTVSGDASSTSGPLQGSVDGQQVAFLVHWTDFQAITAWVGRLDEGSDELVMLWQMTSQTDPGQAWASINAGADTFSRIP